MEVTLEKVIYIGILATLVMDAWSLFQSKVLRMPSLDYGLVGRWVLYFQQGILVHRPITKSAALGGEKLLGWVLHYLVGIGFGFAHVMVFGLQPNLAYALITGVVTLVFPYFIIQPCLGFGLAACKTPFPARARVLSFCTHVSYGLGLYVALLVV